MVPGWSRDGTEQDLETLKVPEPKKSKSPMSFLKVPGLPARAPFPQINHMIFALNKSRENGNPNFLDI